MKRQPFVRGALLNDVARLCAELGLDSIEMLRRAGLTPEHLNDRDLHVSVDSLVELLEVAAAEAELEDFGLQVAQARGLPDLGPVSLLMREDEIVRDAIRTLARSMFLHSDGVYILPELDGEQPIVILNIMTKSGRNCRQATELAVSGITQILRWMLGAAWSPLETYFMHDRPASVASHQVAFGCPSLFKAEFNGLALRPHDIGQPLPASSPVFRHQVDQYIKLIGRTGGDMFLYNVSRLVTLSLQTGSVDAASVASSLNVDRRTMNRRLSRHGLSFTRVIDDVRKSLAAQHLLGSEKSLSEIAELLGFASLSAFSRWHRQAVGTPPREWRHQHR